MAGVGNAFRITGTFQQNGVNADPSGTVTLTITSPAGTATVYTSGAPSSIISHDGVGLYHADFYPTVAGRWAYEWSSSSGAGQADDQGTFVVEGTSANLYASVNDVRHFGLAATDAVSGVTLDDALVADRLDVASRIIDDYCGTTFGRQLRTVTVTDVRTAIVPLPRPFTLQIASPGAPTGAVNGTASTALLGAQVVAVNGNGDTIPGPVGYIETAPAALDGTNSVTWSWSAVTDARDYRVIRSFGGPAQGLVAMSTGGATTFTDTGQATQAYSATVMTNPLLENAQVAVDGRPLNPTGFIIDDTGLRLYLPSPVDVDGFPRRSYSAVGLSFIWSGTKYGSQVSVTGLFGYDSVPQPVRQACVLVTAYLLQNIGETLVDVRVQDVQVEGYRVRYDDRAADQPYDTTGVLEADRLLRPYRVSLAMVG